METEQPRTQDDRSSMFAKRAVTVSAVPVLLLVIYVLGIGPLAARYSDLLFPMGGGNFVMIGVDSIDGFVIPRRPSVVEYAYVPLIWACTRTTASQNLLLTYIHWCKGVDWQKIVTDKDFISIFYDPSSGPINFLPS